MWLPRRVDKYLRECAPWSLGEIRAACAAGRVTIDGHARDPAAIAGYSIAPDELVFEGDVVRIDQKPACARVAHDYLAFHKPLGVTTTTRDPQGREDLSAWLRQMPEGVFPVGRLDRMTSGLLLCTNDGDLAYALLHPIHKVEKRYWLRLEGPLNDTDPRCLALVQGVSVEGQPKPFVATSVAVIRRTQRLTELELCIREGRNRQIRKMCHALGLRLVGLHRDAIGSIGINRLAVGGFRHLLSEEVASLWSNAGGRALLEQRQLQALRRRAQAAAEANRPLTRLEQWLTTLPTVVTDPR
jgi:23S rRNA pseudouridine2605 synthase